MCHSRTRCAKPAGRGSSRVLSSATVISAVREGSAPLRSERPEQRSSVFGPSSVALGNDGLARSVADGNSRVRGLDHARSLHVNRGTGVFRYDGAMIALAGGGVSFVKRESRRMPATRRWSVRFCFRRSSRFECDLEISKDSRGG